ncbi:extensin-like domain-containing protein [Paracoccus beibuensis]|uniref:extensin-like domain-containing protein n=1 Tax=Paracoccus beibuensis TaxID=547602 RepID=UPI00223F58DE|nr:extensin family protein [Paracoccus beibuensis]
MTLRALCTAACAMLLAAHAPVFAQDRPPEAPATTEMRPPERPAEATEEASQEPRPAPDGAPAPAGPVDAQEPAPKPSDQEAPAEADQAPAEAFGPPPPPVWFTLAESDESFAACRLALSLLRTRYVVEQPVTDADNRDCGIARPIRVSEIVPGIQLTGDPVMRCDTARALGFWTRDFLQPAAALLPGAPRIEALQTGPAYTCRDRVGTGAADPKPSEHAYGNAIDIMGFQLTGSAPLTVLPRAGDGDSAESFLRAARGTACLLFTTVLGPGSNAAHDDHLHLDLAARNGGWRLCE